MKLAATVILFNPPADVYNNIMSYYNFVDLLIVIDNSSKSNPVLQNAIGDLSNTVFFQMKDNIGIAKALNIAAQEAMKNGFEWLLTMDQDSCFNESDLTNYLGYIDGLDQKNMIGMFGVNYENKMPASIYVLEEVSHLITSGSVLNLLAYKKAGPFDERFFIDEVDAEYCYRLKKNDFRICMVKGSLMNHNLGQDIIVRNWFVGKKVRRNIHSPLRIYYMVRNFLLLSSIYKKDFPGEFRVNSKVLLNRIKNAILYSGKRYQVIKFLFRGRLDYYRKKFGKFEGKI